MPKRIVTRGLAIALALAVYVLSTQAVSHCHDNALDDQHCQVCQIGHVAIPQPAAPAEFQAPTRIERFAPAEEWTHSLKQVPSISAPRAPPA
jgi:hypothetical protein